MLTINRNTYSNTHDVAEDSAAAAFRPLDLKIVSALNGILYQATDTTLVVPMVLASPVASLTRFGVLRGLLGATEAWYSRGIAASAISSGFAFLGETTFFTGASRGLTHLLKGPVAWDVQSIAHDWAMTGLNLALLKSASFAGRQTVQWKLGPNADPRAMFWTGQASAYLGLVSSLGIQKRLYPELHPSDGNIWLEGLGTHLALGMGAAAGRRALGARFQAAEQRLVAKAHILDRVAKSGGGDSDYSNLALVGVGRGQIPSRSAAVQGKKSENIWAMADHSGQELEGAPETTRYDSVTIGDWNVARPNSWLGTFANEGEVFTANGKLVPELIKKFGEVTQNEIVTHSGFAPSTLTFVSGFPIMFDVLLRRMTSDKGTSIIHAKETSTFHKAIRSDAELKIRVTPKITGKPTGRQIAKIKTEIFDAKAAEGEGPLAEGMSTLFIQKDAPMISEGVRLSEEELAQLPKEPVMEHHFTADQIEDYARESGDYNPIHMLEAAAQNRGLPGRIAHGMLIQSLANRALFFADTQRDPSQPPRFTTDFKGIVRPGDHLRFFVEPFEEKETTAKGKVKVMRAGNRVTVLNQANQLVLQMVDEAPGEQARRVQEGHQVKYVYRKIEYKGDEQKVKYVEVPINAQAGIHRVKEIVRVMAVENEKLGQLPNAVDQPNIIIGVSSGYGLHDAISAIVSKDMLRGVGIFFEPLPMIAAENSLFINALENVEGVRFLAESHGIDFPIFYTSGILIQKDGSRRALNPAVTDAIRAQQSKAAVPDIRLLNAIASSTHIGPLPGVKTSPYIPTLDLTGALIFAKVKAPDPDKGIGTLTAMGHAHRALLEELKGFFGPNTITLFPTWGGGSQNIFVMKGIYGDGYLGLSKQIGEVETLEFHLLSRGLSYALGHHKVIRLPSFNSRALWGILGGPVFGLTAQGTLEHYSTPDNPLYQDLTKLAPRARIILRSGIHVRENPLAQIELDSAEITYMGEINRRQAVAYQRLADRMPGYVDILQDTLKVPWDGTYFDPTLLKNIPNFSEAFKEKNGFDYAPFTLPDGSVRLFKPETTQEILKDLVPENWKEIMPAPETAPK